MGADNMEQLKAGFDDHESRIKLLEQNYSRLEGKIQTIENGQLQLENTVLKTSSDQKELLNKLIEHFFDLKKTRIIGRKEIWVTVLGGGSIVTLGTLLFNYFF